MTLYEGIILANIAISVWTTYQIGRIKTDVDNLYEGVSLAIDQTAKT